MVILKDTLYIYMQLIDDLRSAPLTELKNLSTLTPPPDVYRQATLTTYQSQLVLVGGENSRGEKTNKLWASDDGNNWHQSLPPVLRCRSGYGLTAVSCASPGCLIVSGGEENSSPCTMEVLVEGEWLFVPLPDNYSVP